MNRANRGAFTHVNQILFDLLCLVAAFAITDSIAIRFWRPINADRFLWLLVAYPVIFFMIMQTRSMYIRTTFLYWCLRRASEAAC